MSSHYLIKATTCLILLSFINSPTTTTAHPGPIIDIDGDELVSGAEYYMTPVMWGAGGGVNYAKTQDYYSRCPTFAVSQSPDNHCGSDYGHPIIFTPINSDEKNITDTNDVSVSFAGTAPRVPRGCDRPSMSWKMNSHGNNQYSADLGMFHFGGLGVGDDDQSSAFKIVKNDAYGYILTYCPTNDLGVKQGECGSLKPVYDRNYGFRRLVLSDNSDPFRVMFVKAKGGRSPY